MHFAGSTRALLAHNKSDLASLTSFEKEAAGLERRTLTKHRPSRIHSPNETHAPLAVYVSHSPLIAKAPPISAWENNALTSHPPLVTKAPIRISVLGKLVHTKITSINYKLQIVYERGSQACCIEIKLKNARSVYYKENEWSS